MISKLIDIGGARRFQLSKPLNVSDLSTLSRSLSDVAGESKVYITEVDGYFLVKVEL